MGSRIVRASARLASRPNDAVVPDSNTSVWRLSLCPNATVIDGEAVSVPGSTDQAGSAAGAGDRVM